MTGELQVDRKAAQTDLGKNRKPMLHITENSKVVEEHKVSKAINKIQVTCCTNVQT